MGWHIKFSQQSHNYNSHALENYNNVVVEKERRNFVCCNFCHDYEMMIHGVFNTCNRMNFTSEWIPPYLVYLTFMVLKILILQKKCTIFFLIFYMTCYNWWKNGGSYKVEESSFRTINYFTIFLSQLWHNKLWVVNHYLYISIY